MTWLTSPAGIYLFKVNKRNARTMCEICSKLTIKTQLTLNRFCTWSFCFYCWLWASKCRLGLVILQHLIYFQFWNLENIFLLNLQYIIFLLCSFTFKPYTCEKNNFPIYVREEIFVRRKFQKFLLTHLFPMHPFSNPWEHQKTVRSSDVFRGRERLHWEKTG